jgi:zinc protease
MFKVWNVPEWTSRDLVYLDLAGDNSGFRKTQPAPTADWCIWIKSPPRFHAANDKREIAGQFYLDASAKPGVELAGRTGPWMRTVHVLAKRPGHHRTGTVKTQYLAGFVRGIERIGGFGGKSDILASNEVFAGDPAFYKSILKTCSKPAWNRSGRRRKPGLSDGVYVLEVKPFEKYETAAGGGGSQPGT